LSTSDIRYSPISQVTQLLFFQSAIPHSDLPSFPTRRSSDLGVQPSHGAEGPSPREQAVQQQPQHHRREREGSVHHREGRAPAPEDRKSTRLNSSHRTISYAVFCLKKKSIIPLRTKSRDNSVR